jgi:hypothetical protein
LGTRSPKATVRTAHRRRRGDPGPQLRHSPVRAPNDGEQGTTLADLAVRLDVARAFLQDVGARVAEEHHALLIERHGATAEQIEANSAPWDELEQLDDFGVQLPARTEHIARAWYAVKEERPWVCLESSSGSLWQLNENGLSACGYVAREPAWVVCDQIQAHLPAGVTSRPSARSNPPEYRAPFNYDLRFSTGMVLRVEKLPGAEVVTWEVMPWRPRQGSQPSPDSPKGGRK